MKKTFRLLVLILSLMMAACGGGGGGGGPVSANNANLSGLTVSDGTLSPAFNADTTSYSVEVAAGVASISVTPTAESGNASITVNGTAVTSGSASEDITLSTGANTITIIVTAEDGTTTKTYTITVTKLAPAEPSNNANLAGLTLSQGTLAPSFSANTTSYSAEVQYNIASLTVTPTAAGVNASITVNGTAVSSGSASGSITLNTGANTITVLVTAEDGTTTKTYTVTVTKLVEPSHNADLASLTLSQGTLSPVFSSATMTYTAEVPYGTASITVTPTAAGVSASITVNGTPVSSGTATNITLNTGANTITVLVTAEDGMTPKTYTVTVTVKASVIDLPRTGQTTCYDAAGAVISCGTTTGQGQDGALQKGVAWPDPRFTVASSGTGTVVTDNLTGLMWTGDPTLTPLCSGATTTLTWQGALDYVSCLNTNSYLGHNDWRLPNRKELRSLVNYGQTNSAAWLNTQGFSNVQAAHYWSSSTDVALSTALALFVNMNDGWAALHTKTTYNDYVWPVRSGQGAYASADLPRTGQTTCYDAAGAVISCATTTGQGQDGALQKGVAWPDPRFTVASSGTGTVVTDNLTGLMWAGDPTLTAPCSSATTTTWQGALDYAACLNANSYLEHNDWRLPNVNELESLVHAEFTKETTCSGACTTNAAWLNSLGFSNVQATHYWSSSTYASLKSVAWIVHMQIGYVPAFNKTDNYCVWPVRGGQ